MDKRDSLAGSHRTISDQLNARLSESPRFFWVLVVASAGYGYVLWTAKRDDHPYGDIVIALAAILSYVAILWASWYLAALGYAFRFLQNCQHCIEHALEWDLYTPSGPVTDGEQRRRAGEDPHGWWARVFRLLPGIYHAHAFGLIAFPAIVTYAFCWYSWLKWPRGCVVLAGILAFGAGLLSSLEPICITSESSTRRSGTQTMFGPCLNRSELAACSFGGTECQ